MNTRTWAAVMAEMCTRGIESTRERCQRAVDSQEFDALRNRPLVQTTAEEMLTQLHKNTKSLSEFHLMYGKWSAKSNKTKPKRSHLPARPA